MALEAFKPAGTVVVAATTSNVSTTLPSGGQSVLITNAASDYAFVRLGVAGEAATLTDFPVPSGASRLLFREDTVTTVHVILNSGTGTVFATVGRGSAY